LKGKREGGPQKKETAPRSGTKKNTGREEFGAKRLGKSRPGVCAFGVVAVGVGLKERETLTGKRSRKVLKGSFFQQKSPASIARKKLVESEKGLKMEEQRSRGQVGRVRMKN